MAIWFGHRTGRQKPFTELSAREQNRRISNVARTVQTSPERARQWLVAESRKGRELQSGIPATVSEQRARDALLRREEVQNARNAARRVKGTTDRERAARFAALDAEHRSAFAKAEWRKRSRGLPGESAQFWKDYEQLMSGGKI